MKTTKNISFAADETAFIETNPSNTYFQITAFGAAGTVLVEAQTFESGPWEPVLATSTDTEAIQLDLVTTASCRVGPYSIKKFRLTPQAGASAFTVIFSSWGE